MCLWNNDAPTGDFSREHIHKNGGQQDICVKHWTRIMLTPSMVHFICILLLLLKWSRLSSLRLIVYYLAPTTLLKWMNLNMTITSLVYSTQAKHWPHSHARLPESHSRSPGHVSCSYRIYPANKIVNHMEWVKQYVFLKTEMALGLTVIKRSWNNSQYECTM